MGVPRTMTLTMRIGQDDGPAPGQATERKLDHGRIVIGRGVESDWVLKDPERTISKRHCIIERVERGYEITDLSTNGVFLNDDDDPIGIGNSRLLRHGDRVRIGSYALFVDLSPPQHAASPELVRFDGEPGASSPIVPVAQRPTLTTHGLSDLDRGAPTDAFFAPPEAMPAARADPSFDWRPAAPVSAAQPGFAGAQSPQVGLYDIPIDWDGPPASPPAAPMPINVSPANVSPANIAPAIAPVIPQVAPMAPPVPLPVEPVPPAPAAVDGAAVGDAASAAEGLAAFLAGAGLDPTVIAGLSPAETMRRAGELLRIAVDGLMAVLASRRSLKSEFRLSSTEFRPVENNPLKFSVDAEQAMQMLIGRPQRGFLPATEAFREAVDDLRKHEVAMLAGMQEAWLTQLRRFNPRDLTGRLEDDSGLVNFLGSKKARCWDAFVTLYDSIAGNADNEWERTFQNIFGAAYERSMEKQSRR